MTEIDLDRYFKNAADDWDASPGTPIWLPRKWGYVISRRNKQAHAFTAISCFEGEMHSTVALCGFTAPSGTYTYEFEHERPSKDVCERCSALYGQFVERLASFHHSDEAQDMRRKVAKAGMLYKSDDSE